MISNIPPSHFDFVDSAQEVPGGKLSQYLVEADSIASLKRAIHHPKGHLRYPNGIMNLSYQ